MSDKHEPVPGCPGDDCRAAHGLKPLRVSEAGSVSSKAQLTRLPLYNSEGERVGTFGAQDASSSLARVSDSEHDEDVPLNSLKSDIKRKVALRQVMSKPDAEGERWAGGRQHGGSRSLAEPEPRGSLRNRSRIRDEERSATGETETEEIVEPAMRDRRRAWSKAGEGILDELMGDDDKDYCNPDSDDYDPDKCEEQRAETIESFYALGMRGAYSDDGSQTGPANSKEKLNYRYSGARTTDDPQCSNCVHFHETGGNSGTCDVLKTMVRGIDLCDKFEASSGTEAVKTFKKMHGRGKP